MSSVPTKQDLKIASAICSAVAIAFGRKADQFGLLAEQCSVKGESQLGKIFDTGFTMHGLRIRVEVENYPELFEFLNSLQAQQAPQVSLTEPEEMTPSPFDPLNLWGEQEPLEYAHDRKPYGGE